MPNPMSENDQLKSFWEQGNAPAAAREVTEQQVEANRGMFFRDLDLNYVASLLRFVLEPIEKFYFRARFEGFEGDDFPHNPYPDRPLIFVSNHSGMAFPWDAIIFASGLLRRNKFDLAKAARPLVSPMLANSRLMSPFLIGDFWRRMGGIDATFLNFETLMRHGLTNVLIYPEGIDGIGKGFNHRYELQRLSTSTLRMSLKHKADIIPFATVNAEYIHPYSYSFQRINEFVRQFSIPFLPISPLALLVPFQPWLFYFALPAKMVYVRGPRIRPYELLQKPIEEVTEEELYRLRDQIHLKMQSKLDQAVVRYGREPYDWGEFFFNLANHFDKLLFFLPPAWPYLFREHERRYRQLSKRRPEAETLRLEQLGPKELRQQAEHFQAVALSGADQVRPAENSLELLKGAIEGLVKNPEVLVFYLPVVGLLPMALSDTVRRKHGPENARKGFLRRLFGV